jgi:predicted ArsR family transcriptional regulator
MHEQPQPPSDPVAAIALLDEPKRRRLYEYVTARHEPVGRDEAASELGIGRELAAFHLDRLATAGLLDVEYRRLGDRRGPGAGRPAKLYRRSASEFALSLPARDYERLAEMLAGAIERADARAAAPGATAAAHPAEQAADEGAREWGRGEGRAARPAKGSRRGGRSATHARLLEVLGEIGYEPTTTPDGTIRLQNCPYHALSATHRDLTCGMNLAWAEGVLEGLGDQGGKDTGLVAELAPEPGYCCVVFRDAEVGAPSTDPG